MKTKIYVHPVTHKAYHVWVHTCTTQQGNCAHIVTINPVSGGTGLRFIRYSRGEYRKVTGDNLVPCFIHDYFPGLTVRGLL